MTRTTLRTGAAIIAGVGLLAGASAAMAVPSTLPAAAPKGADVSTQLQFQVKPSSLGQAKATSYFYLDNGGGQVKVTAMKTSGYDGSQTVTVTPPSGQKIIQGMATISGGDLGAMVIKSTSSTAAKYTINLSYPGSQGTPGKLTFRLQLGM